MIDGITQIEKLNNMIELFEQILEEIEIICNSLLIFYKEELEARKNKISNIVEVQGIKNISIDNQIAELKKWKEVINFVFEEIAEENVKLEAMQHKYLCKLPEFTILEMLPISRGTLRNYINEFIMEICLIATE